MCSVDCVVNMQDDTDDESESELEANETELDLLTGRNNVVWRRIREEPVKEPAVVGYEKQIGLYYLISRGIDFQLVARQWVVGVGEAGQRYGVIERLDMYFVPGGLEGKLDEKMYQYFVPLTSSPCVVWMEATIASLDELVNLVNSEMRCRPMMQVFMQRVQRENRAETGAFVVVNCVDVLQIKGHILDRSGGTVSYPKHVESKAHVLGGGCSSGLAYGLLLSGAPCVVSTGALQRCDDNAPLPLFNAALTMDALSVGSIGGEDLKVWVAASFGLDIVVPGFESHGRIMQMCAPGKKPALINGLVTCLTDRGTFVVCATTFAEAVAGAEWIYRLQQSHEDDNNDPMSVNTHVGATKEQRDREQAALYKLRERYVQSTVFDATPMEQCMMTVLAALYVGLHWKTNARLNGFTETSIYYMQEAEKEILVYFATAEPVGTNKYKRQLQKIMEMLLRANNAFFNESDVVKSLEVTHRWSSAVTNAYEAICSSSTEIRFKREREDE